LFEVFCCGQWLKFRPLAGSNASISLASGETGLRGLFRGFAALRTPRRTLCCPPKKKGLPPEEERVEFIFAHLISGNGPYRTATLNVMPILPLAAAFFFRDIVNDYCHREVYYFVQDLFFLQ
jgi:hypothetical protein